MGTGTISKGKADRLQATWSVGARMKLVQKREKKRTAKNKGSKSAKTEQETEGEGGYQGNSP